MTSYEVSADGKHILYNLTEPQNPNQTEASTEEPKQTWKIIPIEGEPKRAEAAVKKEDSDKDKGALRAENIEVLIDPRSEWRQIFDEAWRINRDYFYAPNMHGVDWKAAREKYAALLPHLATRGDLNRVIQWMCSELAVGHHRVAGGDDFAQPRTVPGGLLGADYAIENERYRFKKVYGGLNWDPQLRAPLREPGVAVKAGDYLLAVAGKDLRPPQNIYSFFENTSGKLIDLTVGPSADGRGARTVSVVPVRNEQALRNRDWVEGNLAKVNAATGGRVPTSMFPILPIWGTRTSKATSSRRLTRKR